MGSEPMPAPRPLDLDRWIAAAQAELRRRGGEPAPATVAELLAERLEQLKLRAPQARETLLRAALVRVVREVKR